MEKEREKTIQHVTIDFIERKRKKKG